MLKIGMLTSGGDCQALNAAMRGVALTLFENCKDVCIYGFTDGYKGLMYGDYTKLKREDFEPILGKGGTILGTSRMPFKYINEPDENGNDKIDSMIKTYKKLELDCLVVLGGNGSHKTANLLFEKGLNVVTLPKTIDNDIAGTDVSFGFYSAVDIAARSLECVKTTADSHRRVFVVEIMGHKTGWMTLYAGIAASADVILLPEIPYDIDEVLKTIEKKTKAGNRSVVIAAAEGIISAEDAKLTKKELKAKRKTETYLSPAYKLADEILKKTGREVRVTVPGHIQRGGDPCTYDRILATRLGAKAAELIMNKEYGYMASFKNNAIDKTPLSEVAGKTKLVDPDDNIIKEAASAGISFGCSTL